MQVSQNTTRIFAEFDCLPTRYLSCRPDRSSGFSVFTPTMLGSTERVRLVGPSRSSFDEMAQNFISNSGAEDLAAERGHGTSGRKAGWSEPTAGDGVHAHAGRNSV